MEKQIKLFRHVFTKKYPRRSEQSISIQFTKTEESPYSMFSREYEISLIDKKLELDREISVEKGGAGEIFLSNIFWKLTKEEADKLGDVIDMIATDVGEDLYRPRTIAGYRAFQIKEIDENIPTEEYTCTEVEFNESFINKVDDLSSRAVCLWGFSDPEDAIQRLWEKADRMASTEIEKEYINSLEWM
jgi:hypothetical protein